jgi:hypothetical protein
MSFFDAIVCYNLNFAYYYSGIVWQDGFNNGSSKSSKSRIQGNECCTSDASLVSCWTHSYKQNHLQTQKSSTQN